MGLGVGGAAIAAAALGAAGSIGGGMLGASGAENAANTQAQTQMNIFDQTQKNLAPFIQQGGAAFSQLGGLLGFGPGGFNSSTATNAMNTVQNMPGYQFSLGQGMKATDAAAAARGLNLSGGQVKDEQQFAQGTAQGAWNAYMAQLTQSAGLGESAAAGQGQIGAQTGASVGSNQFYGGLAATGQETQGLYGALNNSIYGYQMYNNSQQNSGSVDTSGQALGLGQFMPGYQADMISSDVRLKKDIRRVGRTDEGHNVYTYRFKSGGPTQMGVMAQEIERTRPDAVITLPSGFKAVRYGKLKSPLSDLLKEAA